MAHGTKINGTSYGISGGKTKIGGTAYSISKGRTKVGGTGYDVSFTFVELITFTLCGTTYNAEAGMTWVEWAASEYNTDDIKVNYNAIMGGLIFYGTTSAGNSVSILISGDETLAPEDGVTYG